MYRVSAVLPTYNEKENINFLILSICRQLSPPPEIIVVDDNSPDKTWEIVDGLQKYIPDLKLRRRMVERGLASAIRDGTAIATGDAIVWMDSDFSHPPDLIPEMLKLLDKYDIVVASRYVKGGGQQGPFFRDFTSRTFNLLARCMLAWEIRDWTSGYAMVKKGVLEKVKIKPLGQGYGEYFLGLLYEARAHGFKIAEIPYVYVYNSDHISKTSPNLARFLKLGVSYGLSVIGLRFQALRGKL